MSTAATLSRPQDVEQPLTVEEWFTLPGEDRFELFEGVLLCMAPPSRRHQDAVGEIFLALKRAARAAGGYAGIAPLGVALESRVGFLPDVVYVSPERLAILSDRGIEAAPDVVVEVLSRSTSAFDRGTKLKTYLARGVREAWLVDLSSRTTEVHRPRGKARSAPFGQPIPTDVVVGAGDCGLGSL